MRLHRLSIALAAAALALPARADQPSLKSHEVNADHTVTFRYYGPAAKAVTVALDYSRSAMPLAKGADGVWTLTSAALDPALHMYSLTVDGTPVFDPLNRNVDPNLVYVTNEVTVGGAPQPWDLADVPHGVVHHHLYNTHAVLGLPGDVEDYYVYTPPGYDPAGARRYPVLYLLHGWSSMADAWTHEGQVNLMLDNLIAAGKAVPMVVVMPLGYGDMSFVLGGFGQWNDEGKITHNVSHFSAALVGEILPRVEKDYRVGTGRADRAIAGLSMGGEESLVIGLGHADLFGYVGGFSAAILHKDLDALFPGLSAKTAPSLVWMICGTEDELIGPQRVFAGWLKARGLAPVAVETPGIHNWVVWRKAFLDFAPQLFRPAAAP